MKRKKKRKKKKRKSLEKNLHFRYFMVIFYLIDIWKKMYVSHNTGTYVKAASSSEVVLKIIGKLNFLPI